MNTLKLEENKYDLTMHRINNFLEVLTIKDIDRLGFWYNGNIKGWIKTLIVSTSKKDLEFSSYNSFSVSIYDKPLNSTGQRLALKVYANGDMCSYNFNDFYKKSEYENSIDLKTHSEIMKVINELIDGKFLKIKKSIDPAKHIQEYVKNKNFQVFKAYVMSKEEFLAIGKKLVKYYLTAHLCFDPFSLDILIDEETLSVRYSFDEPVSERIIDILGRYGIHVQEEFEMVDEILRIAFNDESASAYYVDHENMVEVSVRNYLKEEYYGLHTLFKSYSKD